MLSKLNICAALLTVFLITAGCDDVVIINYSDPERTQEYIRMDNGFLIQDFAIKEFVYKDHTYIGFMVRDGMSLSHAGHCPCNLKNK